MEKLISYGNLLKLYNRYFYNDKNLLEREEWSYESDGLQGYSLHSYDENEELIRTDIFDKNNDLFQYKLIVNVCN